MNRLNGDGLMANETRIQTTGTTSVSTCRPAYCFTCTSGKSILDTKIAGKRSTGAYDNIRLPAVQRP